MEVTESESAAKSPPNVPATNKLPVHVRVEDNFARCRPRLDGLNTKQTVHVSPDGHTDVVRKSDFEAARIRVNVRVRAQQ